MSTYLQIALYLIFGLVSGIFGGLGMGGGTLLIPLLTIFLNTEQKLSQGINLLSFLVMSSFALILHYKNGYLKTEKLWIIILSGVVFSVIGAFCAKIIPSQILKIIFGFFLCVLAIISFIKTIKRKKMEKKS